MYITFIIFSIIQLHQYRNSLFSSPVKFFGGKNGNLSIDLLLKSKHIQGRYMDKKMLIILLDWTDKIKMLKEYKHRKLISGNRYYTKQWTELTMQNRLQ